MLDKKFQKIPVFKYKTRIYAFLRYLTTWSRQNPIIPAKLAMYDLVCGLIDKCLTRSFRKYPCFSIKHESLLFLRYLTIGSQQNPIIPTKLAMYDLVCGLIDKCLTISFRKHLCLSIKTLIFDFLRYLTTGSLQNPTLPTKQAMYDLVCS